MMLSFASLTNEIVEPLIIVKAAFVLAGLYSGENSEQIPQDSWWPGYPQLKSGFGVNLQ